MKLNEASQWLERLLMFDCWNLNSKMSLRIFFYFLISINCWKLSPSLLNEKRRTNHVFSASSFPSVANSIETICNVFWSKTLSLIIKTICISELSRKEVNAIVGWRSETYFEYSCNLWFALLEPRLQNSRKLYLEIKRHSSFKNCRIFVCWENIEKRSFLTLHKLICLNVKSKWWG